MDIKYKNKGYEKVCTVYSEAIRVHGKQIAYRIHHRMKELQSAETEQDLFFIDRCHALKGKRKTQYSLDLGHPFRMVFELASEDPVAVRIVEIGDYHGKQ